MSTWKGTLIVCAALGSAACDGSLRPVGVDAGEPEAPADASVSDPTPLDAPTYRFDAPPADLPVLDARIRRDAPQDLASAPLPPDVQPPRRMIPGPATLVGDGANACTNQDPPSGNGDRWCAFERPGPSGMELWVFDVTAAASGAAPVCDGTSPTCIRMTANLWTDEPFGGPPQEQAHRFDGDTLLFHTPGSSTKDESFRGPIWAWRPGWAAPRMLAANGLVCYGHDRQPLAFCIDDADRSSAVEFNLTAGSIDDPTFGPLRTVDRARLRRADGEDAFAAWFSDDGGSFFYSTTPTPDAGTAAFRIVRTGDLGVVPPTDVLPDVMSWQVANDGQRLYYLSNYNPDTAEGVLMMADFPSGANPRPLAHRTGRYVVLDDGSKADRGVGYFVVNTGRFLSEYRVISNRDDLASAHTVFRYHDQLEDFHLSRNQRYTGYAKFDSVEGFNGYLALTDGSGECVLNSEQGRPAFEYTFLDNAGLVFWIEEADDDTTAQDGWFGDPDGCRDKQRFAYHIGYYKTVRDDGLIFGDDYDGDTITLRYARVDGGRRWPAAGPVKVRERVSRSMALIGPGKTHLVFQVSKGAAEETGVYLFGPLPFGGP